MRRTIRALSSASLVVVSVAGLALLEGCGGPADELKRQTIVGTVKWKGEPLKTGLIQFQPSSPGASTAGGAGISEGSYVIPRAEGLVAGSYRVSITSASAAGPPAGALPGDPLPPPKEPIPAKYNSQTALAAEVKEGGPNKFDFDLLPK